MRGTLAIILVLGASFFARQLYAESEDEKKLSLPQRMQLQRMKFELNLDDEQVEKVRAAMLEEKDRTRKAILEVLDEKQKESFEAMEREGPGRGPGGIRFGGPGGMIRNFSFNPSGKGGPFGITVKELKKEVSITEEEAAEVTKIFKRYREKKQEAMRKMMEDFDIGNIGKMFGGNEELDKQAVKRIRKALAEERREKFDAFVAKKRKKKPGFITRMFGQGGEELDIEGLGDIGKSIKESLKGLKDRLKKEAPEIMEGWAPGLDEIARECGFEGIEGEILKEKLKELLDGEKAYRKFMAESRKSLREAAGEGMDDEGIRTRLDAFRKERDEKKSSLRALKEDLQSLLSYEQEAKLVAMGLLD